MMRLLSLVLAALLGLAGSLPARAQRVAAGGHCNLTIHPDGTLWAWGSNLSGQVGVGAGASAPSVPVPIGPGGTWSSVAAGYYHAAAIRADGTLWAWGANSNGQLGLGSTGPNQPAPTQVGTASNWLSVAVGFNFTLAVRQDGTLWSWGGNSLGQLGQGTVSSTYQPAPTQVGTATTWQSVAASGSGNAAFALRQDGTLWAWGNNSSGQLGLGAGSSSYQAVPRQVGTAAWRSISEGSSHAVAVRTDGTLWAWGNNAVGQLGQGSTGADQPAPVQVGTASTWLSASAGGNHVAAVRQDGTLWTWGRNDFAQLGDGTITDRLAPVLVGSGWLAAYAGYSHTLGVRADGALWSWGESALNELGTGPGLLLTPVLQAAAGVTWQSLAAGDNHSVAVRTDGTLWTWGSTSLALSGNLHVPQRVGTATTWTSLAAGGAHSLGLRQDGTLWAWGYNFNGQLGLGSSAGINQTQPAQVGTATWRQVAAAANYSLGVRPDGTLWAWGDNAQGQLGIGSTTQQKAPVQVGTASTWRQVAAGAYHAMAVRQDGTLWAWGYNGGGSLGTGSTSTNQTTPARVGTASNWLSVACGFFYTLAVRQDGTLWAWGNNNSGQLGLGTAGAAISTPAQVGTATDWAGVAAGGGHSAAWRRGGALYTWGANDYGQLGLGTTLPTPTPTRLGTATWQQVSLGAGHLLGLQADNSLWGAGLDETGQLARPYYQSLPALVPGGTTPLATAPALAAATWVLAPNPAHDAVQVLGLPAGPVQVRVYDARGGLVREAGSATVPTAGLAPGLYLLHAAAAGQPARTLRLVVE